MAEATFTSFSIDRYRLRACSPLPLGDAELIVREGAVIRATFDIDGASFCVRGDLAPLPTFNRETLDAAIDAANDALARWIGQALPMIDFDTRLSEVWEAFVDPSAECPSLSWALFQIAASVHSNARGQTLRDVLGSRGAGHTYYLSTSGGKFKVRSLDDLAHVPTSDAVRLDSNRALTFEDALRIANASTHLNIVYWEEPLADVSMLRAFRDKTGIAVALDESLSDENWRDAPCDCYVIKPTVLGWRRTQEVVRHAHEHNVRCVVSTAYESAIGRAFLEVYANSIGAEVGLGHPQLFEHDLDRPDAISNV